MEADLNSFEESHRLIEWTGEPMSGAPAIMPPIGRILYTCKSSDVARLRILFEASSCRTWPNGLGRPSFDPDDSLPQHGTKSE